MSIYSDLILGKLLVIFLIAVGLMCIPAIFYLLTLQKALSRVSPKNRTSSPRSVWLMLIPIFDIIWQFILVIRISESLHNEFVERNIIEDPQPGKSVGLAFCILGVCSVIPIVGFLTSIGSFICWIIYWVKISEYSNKLALPFSTPRISEPERTIITEENSTAFERNAVNYNSPVMYVKSRRNKLILSIAIAAVIGIVVLVVAFFGSNKVVNNYPLSDQVFKAQQYLEDMTWMQAKKIDNRQSYNGYLISYPNGKYSNEARTIIYNIDLQAQNQKSYSKLNNNTSYSTEPTLSSNYLINEIDNCLFNWNNAMGNFNLSIHMKYYAPTVDYFKKVVTPDYILNEKKSFFTSGSWINRRNEISNIQTVLLNDNTAMTTFNYDCDFLKSTGRVYSVNVDKKLIWNKFSDGWKIVEENDVKLKQNRSHN